MKIFDNINRNIKVYNILLSFFSVGILFFLISFLLKYSLIFADDTDNIIVESFIKVFFNNCYSCGLPIPSILNKLFGVYIPYYLLNIHPSDFKSEYFSYIESFLIIIFCFIPIKIMFLNKSDNIIYKLPIIVYLFVISFYMYSLQKSNLMLLTYDGFFRLNTPVFLFLLLFLFLLKTKGTNNFKDFLLISILTFICCLSNELICITILFGTLIYIFLSLFNNISKSKFYLLVISLIFSTFGALVLIKFGAFIRKSPDIIFNLSYFSNLLKIFPIFLKEYIKYMFLNHFIGYIILISQVIILFTKTKERNGLYIVISYLIGLLIFFFALIGIGEYPNSNLSNTFWIVHPDIQTMYDIILLSFNLYLFSLILKNKILKNSFVYLISAFLILSFGFYIYKNIIHYNDIIKNFLNPLRTTHYKAEKIIRLENLKNKTIYLDAQIFENPINWGLFPYDNKQDKNVIYPKIIYITFLNKIGGNINQEVMFVDKEIADREFIKWGGVFTEEELKNIKFNRLLDNDFLLNKNL